MHATNLLLPEPQVCFFMVFGALIEYACVGYTEKRIQLRSLSYSYHAYVMIVISNCAYITILDIICCSLWSLLLPHSPSIFLLYFSHSNSLLTFSFSLLQEKSISGNPESFGRKETGSIKAGTDIPERVERGQRIGNIA